MAVADCKDSKADLRSTLEQVCKPRSYTEGVAASSPGLRALALPWDQVRSGDRIEHKKPTMFEETSKTHRGFEFFRSLKSELSSRACQLQPHQRSFQFFTRDS